MQHTIELSTKKKQPKAATIRTSLNLQVSGQTLVESQEIYDDILVLKLCGWMGTSELPVWAGAISDTEYQTRSGVFEYMYMQWFVDHKDKGIPFTNIVDKGYRCIMAAWRAGKQLFLQPAFARSDRKFNTREVNRSSTVASDRSGNDRAVNVAKRAGVLK